MQSKAMIPLRVYRTLDYNCAFKNKRMFHAKSLDSHSVAARAARLCKQSRQT